MNRCIKCGREIATGELFCIECSLNPGSSLFEEPKVPERHPAPTGRMQTPKPARRTSVRTATVAAPERKRGSNVGLKVALVLVCLLLVASLAAMVWQHNEMQVEWTRLQTKEADMLLREKEKEELQLEIEDLNRQLGELNALIAEKDGQILSLKAQLSLEMLSRIAQILPP